MGRVFFSVKSQIFLGALLFCALSSCDKTSLKGDAPAAKKAIQQRPNARADKAATQAEGVAPGKDSSNGAGAPDRPSDTREAHVVPVRFAEEASDAFREAFASLSGWVSRHGGSVHAAVVDLQTDSWLLQASAEQAVNVASNAKLVTAAAALELLGPNYSFSTVLLGDIAADGRANELLIRGGGAPDLSTADLFRLVQVAKGRGLEQVGDIVVDQSRFSAAFEPPAYAQQPNEWAPFRANISALALAGNTVTLNVLPTSLGQKARVWYDPPGVVEALGSVETGPPAVGDRVGWSLSGDDRARLRSTVSGSLGQGLGRRRYSRRLDNPRLSAGLALRALLEQNGVRVSGAVRLGQRDGLSVLALWKSRPLAELVRKMGKESNNFYAEMLFVALSAAASAESGEARGVAGWSSEKGAQVVRQYLEDKQLGADDVVVKNGSGLFDANRYSAQLLVGLLASLQDNPRIYQDYVSHLAMGATDGTLRKRMNHHPLAGRIRAKTGTLRACIALSGYLQRVGGKAPLAFSLIVRGISGRHSAIRQRVDEVVLAWAELVEEEADADE